MFNVQEVKQRFGIIGNSHGLNRAIEIATQVAPTDLSVLITGQSGVGKEVFPQIIHNYSHRKHAKYIAVNCGAIPEGTIDSELFGHEKGAFTGAVSARQGYFEVADGGTIFLDEIGELPLSTQVRLLRVLETGEFIRVGSSKVIKTNVRVCAATNVNLPQAIQDGKFREDLYYRLNTVPVLIDPLCDRGTDILLLFRKFASDFAEKYKMPAIRLDAEASDLAMKYNWPGNIRQLKNVTEQISIIESDRDISAAIISKYLPSNPTNFSSVPMLYKSVDEETFNSEREILYKVLFDMRNDMNDLKKLVNDLIKGGVTNDNIEENAELIQKLIQIDETPQFQPPAVIDKPSQPSIARVDTIVDRDQNQIEDTEEFFEESLSLEEHEIDLIQKALKRHNGKRKLAAEALGISERTLYRKIKEYNIQQH